MSTSIAQQIAGHPWLGQMSARELASLEYDWSFWARPEQLPPPGDDWAIWLFLAGRGAGKTRSAGEWCRELVDSGAGDERFALVGPTAADTRDVMVLGESGLVNLWPDHQRPRYEPSKRRVVFHTGAIGTLYSAEEPDRLRGPQHHYAWCDEIAAWSKLEETWSNLQFGLRLGTRPRSMLTTTPRPLEFLRALVRRHAAGDRSVVVTRARTIDNRALPPDVLRQMYETYGGTALGRQELEGEILNPTGGLFRKEWFRYAHEAPRMSRVVVAVDPAITTRNDETGIAVVGRSGDNAYVLEDLSGMHGPDEWARLAIDARDRWRAKGYNVTLVAETNRGGDLVQGVLRAQDPRVFVKEVRAYKGKDTRAEPVAALYEQRRVFHVGKFDKLEDQMLLWDPTGQDELRQRNKATSPDRLDSLVWGILELGFHLTKAPSPAPITIDLPTRR